MAACSDQAMEKYQQWMTDETIDSDTKEELESIALDDDEIEDRFYKDLEFGTAGLRGLIGAGTNRINMYTVGRSVQGLAMYLKKIPTKSRAVVIAYDVRRLSKALAVRAGLVLAANGFKVYHFDGVRSSPELSYAVRRLGVASGIMITASHNPKEYNGLKVYNAEGYQFMPEQCAEIYEKIQSISSYREVKMITEAEGEAGRLLHRINEHIDHQYIFEVTKLSFRKQYHDDNKSLIVVYTPLHGTGNVPVREVLLSLEFELVHVVKEQEHPDPDFSTVNYPNPEDPDAFALSIPLAEQKNADLIIGTDPDCDRLGVMVRDRNNQLILLTGNEVGALLTQYMLEQMNRNKGIPVNGMLVKSIVTNDLGARIAENHGVKVMDTLTGFKYIGELLSQMENTKQYDFILGYEESCGYLPGKHCRDKDGVASSMLICEAAAYYKSKGKSLYLVLQELYQKYGYYKEKVASKTLLGKNGVEQMKRIMDRFRSSPLLVIRGLKITEVQDYTKGINDLPPDNVLKYILSDSSCFCLRPSGTEPKIKVYFSVCHEDEAEAEILLNDLYNAVMARVNL